MATVYEHKHQYRDAKPSARDRRDDAHDRYAEDQSEVTALREELARAKERALQAEAALPHLLGLGQTTVNELLDDARHRAANILAKAQEQLEQREAALERERQELETLYMAIAAEAAALENLRRTLATEGIEVPAEPAPRPSIISPSSSLESSSSAASSSASAAESSLDGSSLDELGSIPATSGFAKAWEQDDDVSMREAFARFFDGDDDGIDPSRRWIMDESDG